MILCLAMLSGLGLVADAALSQRCICPTHTDDQKYDQPLLSHICSACSAIAQSMNYFAKALTTHPTSITSMRSFSNTPPSLLEGSTSEEASEDGESRDVDTKATSITDQNSNSGLRSLSSPLSSPKSKTTYRLAHPPPVSSHRAHLHIRPRILLQLQRVSKTVRPKPILEVLPSVIFATRLARRFPRTFKGKAGLGADDLVIVSSENYETAQLDARDPGELFEDARWEEREIVAAVCQLSKDKSGFQGRGEICLNNGALWTASKLGNGSYEFVMIDEHGLKTVARWVLKPPRQRTTPMAQSRPRSPSLEERKFNFSVLNPNSRRHAVIGTLDQHSIEVSDRYSNPTLGSKSPGLSTPRTPATGDICDVREGQSSYPWHSDRSSVGAFDYQMQNSPPLSMTSTEMNFATEHPLEMNESLRTLILVTGLWVTFQEGFSSSFNSGDLSQGQSTLSNTGSKHQRRSLSLSINRPGSEILPSTAKSSSNDKQSKRRVLSHSPSTPVVPLAQPAKTPQIPPRRTMSTGPTFMRRVTSHRRSTTGAVRLGPTDEFDGSVAEGDSGDVNSIEGDNGLQRRTLAIPPSLGTGSPLRERRVSSFQSSMDSPLEPVISDGLDPPGEPTALSKGATRKPRRLKRLFGLKRQSESGL